MEDWIKYSPDSLQLAAHPMEISKGQNLFLFGDEVTAIYRILEGEVSMTRFSPEGGEIVLYRARAGDFLAEASLFSTHYHCDAICTHPGRCMQLPVTVLRDCLSSNPDFAMEWIATLSGNLRRQRAAQERLCLKSLRMRVIHYLVDRGKDGEWNWISPLSAGRWSWGQATKRCIAPWLKWNGTAYCNAKGRR